MSALTALLTGSNKQQQQQQQQMEGDLAGVGRIANRVFHLSDA